MSETKNEMAIALKDAMVSAIKAVNEEKDGKPVEKNIDDYVKVLQHIPSYDPQTGKPITKPQEQTYGKKEWKLFLQNPNGYVITKYINLPEGCEKLEDYQKRKEAQEAKRVAAAEKKAIGSRRK